MALGVRTGLERLLDLVVHPAEYGKGGVDSFRALLDNTCGVLHSRWCEYIADARKPINGIKEHDHIPQSTFNQR